MIIKGPGINNLGLDDSDSGPGLSLWISETLDTNARWRFRVECQTDSGKFRVGTVYSSPPRITNPIGPLTRLFAIATVPGAKAWFVEVAMMNPDEETQWVDGGPTILAKLQSIDVQLASSDYGPGIPGLKRVGERYTYMAGAIGGGPTPVGVLYGQTVTSWSAIANNGVPGTVAIGGNSNITIPIADAVEGTPTKESLNGPFNFNFSNVAYYIEYLEGA